MKPIPQTIGRSRHPRERQILGRADFNSKRRNHKGADVRSALERVVPGASTDPMRMRDAVALRVVDAENGQLTQGLVVLHPFGDRRDSQHPPDLGDRIDHGAIEGIADEIANERDRKSTRLNSSHGYISYAVFCLKKKKKTQILNILSLVL